jgi:hypothetical protein
MAERFFVMPGRDAAPECESDVTRLALVIGNGAYQAGRLENPTQDASLVADTLRMLGFEVELLLDAGKAAMEHAIVAFGQRVERAGPRAVTFVYFAGHGLQDEGRNYLLPTDAVIPERRFLRSGAIPVTFLVEELSGGSPRANVIVLDACRHALLAQATGTSTPDQMRGLASISNLPDATLVAYSTAANTVAKDGDGRNSPFALALARRLVEPDRKIQDVFLLVARDVAEATGQQQRPAFYLQGGLPDIVLTRPDGPAESLPQEGSRPSVVATAAPARQAVLAAAPSTMAQPFRLPRVSGRAVGIGLFLALSAVVGGTLWLRPSTPAGPPPLPPGTDRFGLTANDWCCTPAPWIQAIRSGRWPQVERAAAEGDAAATVLLAGAQLRGVELDGRTVVRATIEGARSLLHRAAERQHPHAQLLLAGLLERGGAGQRRDRDRAREFYRGAAAGNDTEVRAAANLALAALDTETRLGIVHTEAVEFTREAPAASVQITVYLGFACRGCGDFLRDVVPQLRSRYLDAPERGPAAENIRIVVRPYTRSKIDEDAATLIACAEPRNRLAAAERLAQHEAEWSVRDPTFTERARMEMALKPIGLGRPRSTRCLADPAMGPRLARQSEEAHRLLAISEAPVVFVNGRRWFSPTIETLFEAIDHALPPDDRLSTWRR